MDIDYNTNKCVSSPFYGSHGKMNVRNSMEGVLITHEIEFYSFEEYALGQKVIKDICNSLRHTYSPSLSGHYGPEDKKKFTKFIDSEIEESEARLDRLKFAKIILSRKKVIFKKKEEG